MPKKKQVQVVEDEEKEVMAIDEARKDFKYIAIQGSRLSYHPDEIAEKGANQLLKLRVTTDPKHKKELTDELKHICAEYKRDKSLDTGSLALNCVDAQYRGFVTDVMESLIKEYNIVAPQDKAYAQMAALSLCRHFNNTRVFQLNREDEFLSNHRNNFLSIMSKDADRAFRQYHSIIQYFEGKKRPPLQVNVKTQTAFIAQNQQNIADNNKNNDLQ